VQSIHSIIVTDERYSTLYKGKNDDGRTGPTAALIFLSQQCGTQRQPRENLEPEVVWLTMTKVMSLALFASIVFALPAAAWFAEGHEIVAIIAADSLTPTARSHLGQILGVAAVLAFPTVHVEGSGRLSLDSRSAAISQIGNHYTG